MATNFDVLHANLERISDAVFYMEFDCGIDAGISNTALFKFADTKEEAKYVNLLKNPMEFIISQIKRLGNVDLMALASGAEDTQTKWGGNIAAAFSLPFRPFRNIKVRRYVQWPLCHILKLAKRLKLFCSIIDSVEQAIVDLDITLPLAALAVYPVFFDPWIDQTKATHVDVAGRGLPFTFEDFTKTKTGLPYEIPNDTIDIEGSTYWWLLVRAL